MSDTENIFWDVFFRLEGVETIQSTCYIVQTIVGLAFVTFHKSSERPKREKDTAELSVVVGK